VTSVSGAASFGQQLGGRLRTIIIAILAAHVGLTVWLAAVLSLSGDEAYTLHTTSLSFTNAIHQALVWELQPPLYFATVDLWRHLGGSIFIARLPSVIAVALGVYVMGLAARSYLSDSARPWVMAAVAFNPFIVGIATDARVYGFVFLWSALLMWLFSEAYLKQQPCLSTRIAFSAVAIAALYTQYYTGFLLVAFPAALIVQRRWRYVGAFLALMIPVALALLPLVPFLPAQINTTSDSFVNQQGFLANTYGIASLMIADTLPLSWITHGSRFLYIPIAVIIAAIIWKSDKASLRTVATSPVTISVASTLIFSAAITVFRMPLEQRYTAAFHAPAFIMLFALISGLPGFIGRRTFAIAAGAIIAMSVASLVWDNRFMDKGGDARRTAEFIAAHESLGERIVVFDAQSASPLAYYYHGPNPIVPLPRPVRYDRWNMRDWALNKESEVIASFGYVPQRAAQLWLVTTQGGCRKFPVDFHCSILEDFAARHYTTLIDRQFHGARVRLLRENQ